MIIILVLIVFGVGLWLFFNYDNNPGSINCSSDEYNCGDFSSQVEAQDVFEACSPGDVHQLDRDGNGVACESLG